MLMKILGLGRLNKNVLNQPMHCSKGLILCMVMKYRFNPTHEDKGVVRTLAMINVYINLLVYLVNVTAISYKTRTLHLINELTCIRQSYLPERQV